MRVSAIVAGLGVRGRDWIREVSSHPHFELAACVDTDRETLETVRSGSGLSADRCFTELEEALAKINCDAVIVATPSERHVEDCSSVLTQGRALLVEKPFTMRLPEAVKLVKLSEQKGVPIVVGQNYRYMRSFRTARRIVNEGALGCMGFVVCQYYRVPHAMASWLKSLEDNVLFGIGVHHLDALRYSLGQKVTGVLAESFTRPGNSLAKGATIQVMLRFDQEIRGLYTASYESSGHEFFEKGQEFYARYVGERGTLHVFQRWLMLCEKGRLPRLVRRGTRPVSEERILLEQLHDGIINGAEPDASGRDNLQTMAVVEACLQSSCEQRWKDPQQLLLEAGV